MSTTPRRPAASPAAKKNTSPATAPSRKATAPRKTTTTPAPVARETKRVVAPVKPTRSPAPKTTESATPKVDKAKKPKLVRDSFTIPKAEYAALDTLKLHAAKLGHPVKKSELLRAGLKALSALSDAALLSMLATVPSIKTGRPKKD